VILTAKQIAAREVLNGHAKHILLEGGSRSGKSALIVRNIGVRAAKCPRSRHAILRFRFKHCKDSIGMDTLPKVMESCGIPYTMNRSDWYATLPNKSEIWLGGLDDKERTEKILGLEFVTLYLNEASQIPLNSRNLSVTRLAQKCSYEIDGVKKDLALKMYYDANPPSKAHWLYQMFHGKRDPETKRALENPDDYQHFKINPRDNLENLPPDYIKELEGLSQRMRKRFLDGEYGDAAPGALWTDEVIDRWRDEAPPDMVRVVVAVDPSGADDEDNAHNDAIGIIVCGLGTDGNAYVLEDCTVKAGPKTWGNIAAAAYDRHRADRIIGETNYGGEMVKFVVQAAKPNVPFRKLTASRGKAVRAEPISALTEKGKIRFAGRFLDLEEELCAFTTHGYTGTASPNRADAFVFAMSDLFPGIVQEAPEKKERVRIIAGAGWQG
jgi:hypothetical protein